MGAAAQPAQPWQVSRRHTAPSAAQLREARRRCQSSGLPGAKRTTSPSGRFENRHAVQQQIIEQQRKLLKQQQDQINQLRDKHNIMGLELQLEKTAQLAQRSMPKRSDIQNLEATEQR